MAEANPNRPAPATEWRNRARCLHAEPALFFPTTQADTEAALAVCAQCPVRRDCYEDAGGRGEEWGIWGGEVWDRRVRYRQARRAQRQTAKTGSSVKS